MIDRFDGSWAFLSNFFERPVVVDGVEWPTTEHAFQAMKTLDPDERLWVLGQPTPGRAKRAGSKKGLNGRKITLRQDWEKVKVNVMHQIVSEKFHQHPDLAERLLSTGEIPLVEGNHWGDHFWGVCQGRGLNVLGTILMRVRSELKQERGGE